MTMRLAFVLALPLAAFVAAGGALAASPTLGLRITPAPVDVNVVHQLTVTSLAVDTTEAVTLAVDQAGFTLTPMTFTLAPAQVQLVSLISVGADATLTATVRDAAPAAPGTVSGALAIVTQLRHGPPGPPLPLLAAATLALMGLLAVLVVLRRRWGTS